jgi:ATP-binding cassette subfamily B protein
MTEKNNLLEKLFFQPNTLPESVADAIRQRLPGESVAIYAYCDLDAKRAFADSWLAATENHLVYTEMNGDSKDGKLPAKQIELSVFPFAEIKKLELLEGFTLNRLDIIAENEDRLLASIFFTRRQIRAIGNVRFVVEQKCKRLKKESGNGVLHEVDDPAEKYQEAILQAVREAKSTVITRQQNVFARLVSYLGPHKKAAIWGFTASVILTMLGLLPPYITRVLVDDVLQPAETGQLTDPLFWVWVIVASLALVWAGSVFMNFLRLRLMSFVGERIATQLRDELYQHLQKLSLNFYNQRSTGSIISRVTSDTDRLWDFITFGIIEFIIAVLTLIGVAIALFLQDVSLASLVVIPLPLMLYLFYSHSKRMQGMFLRIWRKWSAMTAVLSDVIPGVRVVKAFAQEDHEIKRFTGKNEAVREEAFVIHRTWTSFWPGMVMLMHICSMIVWAVGAPRVLEYVQTGGQSGMPLGVFIAFTGYMWMFWAPLQNIGMMTRTFNRAVTSASRVFEILDTTPTIVSKPKAAKIDRLEGQIRFREVTFSYDGIRNVLKGVSFDVEPGEMIGLVGPSGGGKSTLVNLICRFYDVADGTITIDGHEVRDLDLHTLRKQIGVVLQEPYLFHGTIAENIAYGQPDVTIDAIIEASKAANAHEFICSFPDAYDSIVGERGLTLSGGERQRISIARAILNKPRLLILDEATSSVDTETEKKIQEAMERLVAGRTTFAIAHRLSTLSAADRLFVMENGKLVEQGTHAELLSKDDGVYARLHNTQAELQALIAV